MRKVAITGLGVVSPIGIGIENFWESIITGKTTAKKIEEIKSSTLFSEKNNFKSKVIIEVEDFDISNYKVPSDIKNLDRFIQFAVVAAELAKKDSGLNNRSNEMQSGRIGVSLSTAICGTKQMEEEFIKVTNKGLDNIDPSMVSSTLYLSSMSNTPANVIASIIGAEGPCITLSTGCIGGIDAIGYAYEQIKNGYADIMVTGASEAPITPITYGAFDVINCLSTNFNSNPVKASRPYDRNRDGFLLSEGSGILILEDYEHAKNRNAKIYGFISGFSNASNALHMTDLVNNGEDLARVIQNAMQEAHLNPNEIDYINGHGSSTPQNDKCETKAIKLAFGDTAKSIPISSTKSMTGHALSAASALEIIACVLSCNNNILHPTINYEENDPDCDLDYIPNVSREKNIKNIVSIASGFSGLHAAIVIQGC